MKSDKKNQPRSWHERDLDRVMLGAVVLNALGTLILGVGHELGLYASTGAIAALLIAGLGIKLGRATVTSRLALALALSLPVMAQMHLPPTSLGLFNAFVTLSLMQAYRDWRPIALLAAVLGLHHVLTAEWLALGFVALQSAVLSGLAIIQQREISTARELEFLVNAMGREGKIRLNFDVVRMQTPTGQRLQHVQQRMASVVGQLHQLSQLMAHTAQQMALDSTDLTGRTETTANGLRDAAMCLNQISIIVESSINASSEALQFARDAADTAKQGNHVVEEVIGTMHNIEASSKRVTDIIAVIDGIAFQTNILSLNAAVEAARAGEQGRGFAVVASEVRNLALRSAEAAKEIRQLIHTSVATVATGTQQVSSAGQTMNQLVEAVNKVGKLFQSSAADTAEYVQGMQTVTESVENLSELTQKNLAISEHARTSASDLLAHMSSLTEALSAFNLGHLASLDTPARQAPDVLPTKSSPAESRRQTPHTSAPAPAPSAAQPTNTVDFF